MRLGDANRQIAESKLLQFLEFVGGLFRGDHLSRVINLESYRFDFLQRLHRVRIKRMEIGATFADRGKRRVGQLCAACASFRPVVADNGWYAGPPTLVQYLVEFGLGIAGKMIDRYDSGYAEFLQVLEMAFKIDETLDYGSDILILQIFPRNSAVVL